MSSGLNSLAAVVWEDLVKPMSWSVTITEGRQVFLTRAIAAFMGLLTVGLAIITTNLDGVLQLGNTAMGVLAGPILAVFLLGFFTTTSNKYGAITGMICGNAFTIWLLVGSLVKDLPRSPSTALPTYTEGCGRNSSFDLDVYGIAKNHSQVPPTFFYIPEGDWQDILYSTSYHLYALSGFLICLIVCLFVSLISRLFLRQYRPVEPLLLHPLVRSKDSFSDHSPNHSHMPPYVLSQFQPYYGGHRGHHYPTTIQTDDWDDTHYRWPSPSLPPTLKKGQKQFGTLDKVQSHRLGRINYAFSRGSPDGVTTQDHISTSSTNDDENMSEEVDEFGDPIKKRHSRSSSKRSSSKSRTNNRPSTDEDDEESWTTEF